MKSSPPELRTEIMRINKLQSRTACSESPPYLKRHDGLAAKVGRALRVRRGFAQGFEAGREFRVTPRHLPVAAFLVLLLLLLLPPCAAPGDIRNDDQGALQFSVDQAVWTGLRNNRSLRVEHLTPESRRQREERERARFDSAITAEVSAGRESVTARIPGAGETSVDRGEARIEAGRSFPSGTRVGLDTVIRREDPEGDDETLHTLRAGLSVTQALLQGAGGRVNRIGIQQAALDTRVSLHELRGFTEALVARIETAYWNLVLAERNLKIVGESAQLAIQQLGEVEQRIEAGVLAPTERAAARAEAALRDGALIRARGNHDRARLALLQLLNPPVDHLWDTTVELTDDPSASPAPVDAVEDHVKLAMHARSDLNAARLALERGELELVRTRNGILPRLDLFVRLGRTAFADSFSDSVDALSDESIDYTAGLQLSYELGRRAARANRRESQLLRDQAQAAIINLEQLAALDVRTAHIEVQYTDEQVKAAIATHVAQEEKLRAEMEKFEVGRSTALLVAQAQRDLMVARLAETEAVIQALIARVTLYRLDGSLLARRGILAPNQEGVMP